MAQQADIPPLTGLRGIAVLLVVYEHYFIWCAPYAALTAPQFLLNTTGTSTFGMTLFFTLSGFVIVYNYWDFGWAQTPSKSFRHFMFLRLSRLYPALILFFAAFFSRATTASGTDEPWIVLAQWLSLQAWYPIRINGNLAGNFGYSIAWSISTELGMYLLFAAVMMAARHLRPITLLTLGAAYVILIVSLTALGGSVGRILSYLPTIAEPLDAGASWNWFYYLSPYFRFSEFLLGAAAASIIMSGRDNQLRPALATAAALGAFGLIGLYVAGFAGLGLHGAEAQLVQSALFAVIMADARGNTRLNRALSGPTLIFFGLISYSVYLFHGLPVLIVGGSQIGTFNWFLFGQFAFNFAVCGVFVSIIGWGSYSLIEMPAQRWLRRFKPRPAAGSATIAAMGAE